MTAVDKSQSTENLLSSFQHLTFLFQFLNTMYNPSLFSSSRFHVIKDRPREIVGSAVATHIPSSRFAIGHISSRRFTWTILLTLL